MRRSADPIVDFGILPRATVPLELCEFSRKEMVFTAENGRHFL
jgi:hypothetical protein